MRSLLDAALAWLVALGYALHEGTLSTFGSHVWCFLYGLWSAAAFRCFCLPGG